MSAAPEELQVWARERRGSGSKARKQVESLSKAGQRPEWLGPRLGVSETIEAARWSLQEETRLLSALAVVPADNLDTWIPIGGGMHDFYGGSARGFEVFYRWSATAEGKLNSKGEPIYKGRADCEKAWRSFARPYDGIRATIETVYYHARANGWANPDDIYTKDDTVNDNEANGKASFSKVFPEASMQAPIVWADLSVRGRKTIIDKTCANTRIALRYLGVECRYDLFHGRASVNGQGVKQWEGKVQDNALHAIRGMIRGAFILEPTLTMTKEAIIAECLEHCFDPVLDYLDGLTWDGQPRLQTWLHAYLGAEDTPLNRIIGGLALVAAVRRAREPGCKFDHVIVLEGKENIGKSRAIEILAGRDNFCDQAILAEKEQRQMELLQGVWLYELAELTGQKRAEVEHAKAFITRNTDRGRRAYGHFVEEQPRHCVLFATCNENRYLVSQTGNRRYLSALCHHVLQDALARDRDQLWAEANAREARRVPIWLPEEAWPAANAMQESRRVQDPWEEELRGIEKRKKEGVQEWAGMYRIATTDLMGVNFLNIPAAQQTQNHGARLNTVMRLLGWEGPKAIKLKWDLSEPHDEKNVYVKWGFNKWVGKDSGKN